MTRFFFDSSVDGRWLRDDEGLEFPSVDHARREALRALGEMAKDELPDTEHSELKITIRDSAPLPLLIATLSLRVER